jgi:hypothetical protein
VVKPARNKRDARCKTGTLLGPYWNEVRRGHVFRRIVVAAADPNAVLHVCNDGEAATAGNHGNRRVLEQRTHCQPSVFALALPPQE